MIVWSALDLINSEARETDQQDRTRDDQGTPEKVTRMRDVSGGVFGRIGEALEGSGGLVDRCHQMRRDVHQVHRDPFGRQSARRRSIGAGERFVVDRAEIVGFLPFRRRNAM